MARTGKLCGVTYIHERRGLLMRLAAATDELAIQRNAMHRVAKRSSADRRWQGVCRFALALESATLTYLKTRIVRGPKSEAKTATKSNQKRHLQSREADGGRSTEVTLADESAAKARSVQAGVRKYQGPRVPAHSASLSV
jgi:hypothetical protein